jgi:probable rRNA maturation factor
VTVRGAVRPPIPIAALVRAVAAALQAARAPTPASMGLVLTGDEEIAALNETHLGHIGPTDVLSFPMLRPGAFPPHAGQDPRVREGPIEPFVAPPHRRPHLGDIVVSVERAVDQAESGRGGQTGDRRWSAADELRLLVTHGTLHLCGWDHAIRGEEAAMRELEQRLLA